MVGSVARSVALHARIAENSTGVKLKVLPICVHGSDNWSNVQCTFEGFDAVRRNLSDRSTSNAFLLNPFILLFAFNLFSAHVRVAYVLDKIVASEVVHALHIVVTFTAIFRFDAVYDLLSGKFRRSC